MNNDSSRLLWLLMAGAMLVVGQLYLTLPLTESLAARWQVSTRQAAWAGSAFGLAYAVGFLLLGRLSDRYGRRTVLLGSLLATAVASVLVASSVHFGMLLAARAVQGLAASAFPPAALALVAEALPTARRQLGLSWMSFAFLAAAPASQFLAAQFAGMGLPVLMLTMAVAYGGLALGLYRLPATSEAPRTAALAPATPLGWWQQTSLMGAWLAAATVLFAFVVFHAGAQAAGLSAGQLQALRLVGLPPLLLSLVAARMAGRIGTVGTARVGLVLAALALIAGLTGGFGWLMLASAVLSGGIALAVPGLIGTVASRAPAAIRAQAISLYSFALFVGASLAPPIAQVLASLPGAAWLLTPATALLCAAAVVNGWTPSPTPPQPSDPRSS